MKGKRKKPFAKKSLGQNFLVDQNIINKIISSLNPKVDETIVEIGAGRGALTEKLVEKSGKVIAIEIDRELIPSLRVMFLNDENFHLIEQDALDINFQNLLSLQSPAHKTKLVANLPYYISTAILQHLIQYRHSFSEMVLMLQREVVERITAETGNKERGYLTVLLEAYFNAEKLFDVSPNAFKPRPKVTSSIMRLITKRNNEVNNIDPELFREIISLGFMQKRKTIRNNLKNAKGNLLEKIENCGGIVKTLETSKIEPQRRAETIEFAEWITLVKMISKK